MKSLIILWLERAGQTVWWRPQSIHNSNGNNMHHDDIGKDNQKNTAHVVISQTCLIAHTEHLRAWWPAQGDPLIERAHSLSFHRGRLPLDPLRRQEGAPPETVGLPFQQRPAGLSSSPGGSSWGRLLERAVWETSPGLESSRTSAAACSGRTRSQARCPWKAWTRRPAAGAWLGWTRLCSGAVGPSPEASAFRPLCSLGWGESTPR